MAYRVCLSVKIFFNKIEGIMISAAILEPLFCNLEDIHRGLKCEHIGKKTLFLEVLEIKLKYENISKINFRNNRLIKYVTLGLLN